MNIDVFNEATELYNKYKLCEDVLEYLSNEASVKGMKYKETLVKFVETFKPEFMMFVHERMTASGEAFEECGKCTCDNCPAEEEPTTPTEPKEPKFAYGEKVEITNGDYKGKVGMVMGFDDTNATYYVVSPQFSMWFPETELKAYVEESEEPEEPTPPIVEPTPPPFPEDAKFQLGERVIANGYVGTIAGYDFIDHKYAVLLDFFPDEDPRWYAEDELEPCTFAVGDRVWLNTSGGEKLLGTIMSYVGEANRYIIDVVDEDGTTHTYHASPNEIEKYEEDGGTVTPDTRE